MFFGRFRKSDESLKYLPNNRDEQIIYGYLQIGDIVKGDAIINKFPWHPHSKGNYGNDNTLYVAAEKLTINGKETNLPGCGTFKYSEELVLTKDNLSRSKWKINSDWDIEKFFESNSISYHRKNNIKNGYFQSAYRGQEFVISENEKVTTWTYDLIKNNS